ncbi:MAG: ribosome biogenesis GTP-binding protein YsxC [Candidatus Pacebacteria bacterium]|nr:ribosome biogenesis GTP-binding protein YsxC [Candidatus Paceibacterota bacterium]
MKIKSAQFKKGVVGEDHILYDKFPQIAFVGRSNVGKSSVLNTLVGSNKGLARTGKKAGKTTEINFYDVNGKYYFVDLPGYGFAKLGIEAREKIREMILGYLTNKEARILRVAIVLDAKVGLTDFDRDILEILRDAGLPAFIILNKTDKLNQKELVSSIRELEAEIAPDIPVFPYSTLTEKRVKELREKLIS